MREEMGDISSDRVIRVDLLRVPDRVFAAEGEKIQALRRSVLQSCDAEAVHDLRVSIRKIRTAIRLFWPILTPEARQLDLPIRELFQSLGEIRNLDIALLVCRRFSPVTREEVNSVLSQRRRECILRALTSLTESSALDRVCQLRPVVALEPDAGRLSGPAHPVRAMHRLSIVSFEKLEKRWSVAELHRLRRRLKRLRYASEFLGRDYGKPSLGFCRRLQVLQDVLGETMDCVTTAELLKALPCVNADTHRECRKWAADLSKALDRRRTAILRSRSALTGPEWKQFEVLLP